MRTAGTAPSAQATRFLGPALGSLHMFFHRLGPVLARPLLLTGDIIEAGEIEHLGIFTDTCDPGSVTARARYWADLPAQAIKYVRRLEELIGCSAAVLSTSPEREDTILMQNPFEM